MEALVDEGLTKSIGISNYNASLILDLLRYARIPPATLQIEHHPYLTQDNLVKFAQGQGIAVTAYSSFGPQSFIELDLQQAKDTPVLFDNTTIKSIAEKKGKTPAQVLLRWATQRDVAVIPKSNNPKRLAQNLDVIGWKLEPGEVEEISGLNKGLRFNDPLNVSYFHRHLPPIDAHRLLCQVRLSTTNLRIDRGQTFILESPLISKICHSYETQARDSLLNL